MTDKPKVEYAKIDDDRITKLLIIIEKAAGHSPKLSAIASEAMLELEAVNAEVQQFRDDRAKVEAEAAAKAEAEEKGRQEATAKEEAAAAERQRAAATKAEAVKPAGVQPNVQ